MSFSYALLIHPLSVDASVDFGDTLTAVDVSAPVLRVGDLGTQRGDGVFETIGVVSGHAQEVDAHLERLRHSAVISDLPEPNLRQWRFAVDAAVQQVPHQGEFVLKLVLSRGVEGGPAPTAWLQLAGAPDYRKIRDAGVRAVSLTRGYTLETGANAPWLLLAAKTLSYAVNMAAIREAHRRGADDVIFFSSDGYVLEGPTSSVIARVNGEYVTPAPHGAILHGTTQQSLFDHLRESGRVTRYRDLRLSELAEADAVWLVSSVRLAVAVTELDGKAVAADHHQTAAFNSYLLTPRR